MKNSKTAIVMNYFRKISMIRKVVWKLPFLRQIFLEKNQLRMEKKQLQREIEKYKAWAYFILMRKEKDTNHKIATIINYCTTDYSFINYCINEVKKFSSQIIVPVLDSFFDGTPENRELLEKTYNECKDVNFVEYKYDSKKPVDRPDYWPNFLRWIGFTKVKSDIEYILFLDADEIIEGDRFLEWLNNFNYKDYSAIYFLSHWYFRETKFRATTNEVQALLVKKNLLNKDLILNVSSERAGTYNTILGKKATNVTGIDDEPMVHHYSWVRTKEEMLKKVQTWSHRKDRDWEILVEKEFQREFTEKCIDFVHGYRYKVVKPYIII